MNIPVSSNTCLRLIKSMEISVDDNLLCIGIDDWAKRKGMDYGTIIVNADTGRPIDLIDSRNSSDVVEWLTRYQKIKYVTRDRSTSYASAIKKALPEAKQIADKFHLVKNLSDAIQEEIRHEYRHLKQIYRNIFEATNFEKRSSTAISDLQDMIKVNKEVSFGFTEKEQKFLQMTTMKSEGHSIADIARKTQTNRRTVNRYLANGIPPIGRTARIDYNRYIGEIRHMCGLEINPTAMFRSLEKIGIKCCERSFTRWFNLNFLNYIHKWNRTYPDPLKVTAPAVWTGFIPSLRKFRILVINPECGVAKDTGECSKDKEIADRLVNAVPILSRLRTLYMDFRNILKGQCANQLGIWINNAQLIGRKQIDRFCNGLMKDILAVKKCHSLPVILDKYTEPFWLSKDISPADLLSLCRPYPDEKMEVYRVGIEVNSAVIKGVINDRQELILPMNSQ